MLSDSDIEKKRKLYITTVA